MSDYLPVILPRIEAIGQEILAFYDAPILVEQKSDDSPLTKADLYSDQELVKLLKPFGLPILSEESAENFDRSKASKFWVIDPLDGTKDFLQKTGEFSIMVGLVEEGEPTLGVVCVPALGKIYYAQKGSGAFLAGSEKTPRKIQASQTDRLIASTFITSRNHFSETMQEFTQAYDLELIKCGSNGVKLGIIAEGMADTFFNPTDKMGLWDICGPQVILEEAGGEVTDCLGQRIDYRQKNVKVLHGIVASNHTLHTQTVAFTSR